MPTFGPAANNRNPGGRRAPVVAQPAKILGPWYSGRRLAVDRVYSAAALLLKPIAERNSTARPSGLIFGLLNCASVKVDYLDYEILSFCSDPLLSNLCKSHPFV